MPRPCSICTHLQRLEIDQAITEGQSFSAIAREYGVSRDPVRRHKENGHVVKKIAKAEQAREVTEAGTLLEQVQRLQQRAMKILDTAEAAGELRTALTGIRELRGILELLAKLQGQLQEQGLTIGEVNIEITEAMIMRSPGWLNLMSRINTALEEYPVAKWKVVEALQNNHHGSNN